MARLPRVHFPGAIYHVMARTNAGVPIFEQASQRADFLTLLGETKKQRPFSLFAYCVMSNHLHLLLQVRSVPLSDIMQRLLTTWARRVNLSHRQLGHVFQGRYKAILCRDDGYLMSLIRYIHQNPVRANVVKRSEDWLGSGHAEYVGGSSWNLIDRDLALSFFGREGQVALERYRRYIVDSAGPELGVPVVASARRSEAAAKETCPTLESLSTIRKEYGELRSFPVARGSRPRSVSRARRMFVRDAFVAGHNFSEIARFLGMSVQGVSKTFRRTLES